MVQDTTNAQNEAIGYARTACRTVMLCSTFSASIAPALNAAAFDFSSMTVLCSTSSA